MMKKKLIVFFYVFIVIFVIAKFPIVCTASSNSTKSSTQAINGQAASNGNDVKVDINGKISPSGTSDTEAAPTPSSAPSTEKTGGGENDSPDTGDILNLMPYIVLLIIPACIILFLMKRRQEDEDNEIVYEHKEN